MTVLAILFYCCTLGFILLFCQFHFQENLSLGVVHLQRHGNIFQQLLLLIRKFFEYF